MALWSDNPILARELSVRLSFRRHSPAQRKAALWAVGLAVPLLYFVVLWGTREARVAADIRPLVVVGLETALLALFSPILAASAFTVEREKQTWNALLMTRLSPKQIVAGKYLGSIAPAALVYACFLPLNAVLAARIGMSPLRWVAECLVLAATVATFGAVGLFFSWACRRTQAANTAVVLAVLALLAGPWLLLPMFLFVLSPENSVERFVPLWGNAFWIMARLSEHAASPEASSARDAWLPLATAVYLAFSAGLTALALWVPVVRLSDGPEEMVH